MRLMLVSEHYKLNPNSKTSKKIPEKSCGFLDNLIRIGNGIFSLLLWEYSQLAVNVLTSSRKISDLIKKYFFEVNWAQNDEKLG